MQTFINGAKYAVSNALAAAIAISAMSNADPAVASAATTPVDGDIVVLQSGWAEANETVWRVAGTVINTSFQLENFDSSDATRYPAGEGAGTYEKVTGFTSVTQVRDVQMSGGEQNYFQWQYVEDSGGRQRQAPTFKSAMSMTLEMDYDPNLAWYNKLIDLDRLRLPVVLRETLPAGDKIYYVGLLAFNKVPTKGINQNMTVKATFSLSCDPVRYGA